MKGRSYIITILIAMSIIVLAGCAQNGMRDIWPLGQEKEQIIAEGIENMSDDAAKVVTATAAVMLGLNGPSDVQFADRAMSRIKQESDVGALFRVKNTRLLAYRTSPDGNNGEMTSYIDFIDGLGRRCTWQLTARYQKSASAIQVVDAAVQPVYDAEPESVMFIVPANAFPFSPASCPESFVRLYQAAGERAISPHDAKNMGLENDWVMIVFFMDRISPSAKMELSLSSEAVGMGGYSKDSRYIDYNGWRVGMAVGRFTIMDNATLKDLYLKAIYTPGEEAGFLRMSHLVGVYPLN